MAIEENNGRIVVTGEDIPVFSLLALRGGLRMELNGLKHSSGISRMKYLAEMGIVEKKNRYSHAEKSVALTKMNRIIERMRSNRANGINESFANIIAAVTAEMAIESKNMKKNGNDNA